MVLFFKNVFMEGLQNISLWLLRLLAKDAIPETVILGFGEYMQMETTWSHNWWKRHSFIMVYWKIGMEL